MLYFETNWQIKSTENITTYFTNQTSHILHFTQGCWITTGIHLRWTAWHVAETPSLCANLTVAVSRYIQIQYIWLGKVEELTTGIFLDVYSDLFICFPNSFYQCMELFPLQVTIIKSTSSSHFKSKGALQYRDHPLGYYLSN